MAICVVVLAILSVSALSISTLRSNQKSSDRPVGQVMAERILTEELYKVQDDNPPGTKNNFWQNDFSSIPFRTGKLTSNHTEFTYSIYAVTLVDVTKSQPVGVTVTQPKNRLKKVDVVVWWWDSSQASRAGYGKLVAQATRLFNEIPEK